jgi:eukaryotic-like serine/threonine-protein kinase
VTTRVSDPLVGRLLDGRYRVDERVARGGMAMVYAGLDTRLDRPVAIKVMHLQYAEDADFVARFGREARAAARLNHPCVVSVHDQGEDAGCVFLIMEYVPGRTLRDLLHERGRLAPAEALDLLEPVLAALAAAHAAGIVHRDVKPENVLLADDGRVKVADFGLARAFSVGPGTTTRTQGVLLGTMAYLSPEQVRQDHADARSDVYAVGVMLYELLTGRAPFTGDSPITVAFQHVNEDVPPPSRAIPYLHPAVDALVARATRRNPDERPADAGRLLQAVREVRRTVPSADLGSSWPGDPARQPTVALAAPVTSPTTAESLVGLPGTAAQPVLGPPGTTAPRVVGPPGTATVEGVTTPRKGPGAVGGPPQIPRAARRRRRWWLIPLVLLLLVALGAGAGYGAWWMTSGRWVRTPSVLNLDRSHAVAKLTDAGLLPKIGGVVFSETVPAGQVTRMSPEPSTRVRKDATVTLTLSKGPERFSVPTLVGSTVSQAASALKRVNLVLGKQTRQYSETVKAGVVISANRLPDTSVPRGVAVSVVVSRGPRPIDVPNLTGAQGDDAAAQLTRLALSVTTDRVFSDTIPAGQVISQRPATGTLFKGGKVTLTVSKGPQLFKVPGVRGKTFGDAQATLEAAGFTVARHDMLGSFLNRVYSQSPGGGSMQRRGTLITLTIV